MTLKETLIEDMKQAMKAHDALKLDTIRLLRSELKNFEIDNGEQDDAGVHKIVAKLIKQWQDALTDFTTAGREDLIAETKAKIEVVKAYLPQQLSDSDLQAIITDVIATAPLKTIGPVTGLVMKRVAGQADGTRVSAMVKTMLS